MTLRIDPDTLQPKYELDPRKVTADDVPLAPITPLPSKKPFLYEIKQLPEWVEDVPAPCVNVSIFDRAYLLMDRTITYSKWAVLILRVAIEFISFIQSLKEKKHE